MRNSNGMKLTSFICVFVTWLCMNACVAMTVDKIVIFGDSLSDNGNLYTVSSAAHKVISLVPIVPMNPPYFNGRFSNGIVWNEIVSQAMNMELANYAYGGAWAESVWNSGVVVPFDLATQVNFHVVHAARDFNKGKHLYVLWAGANDYVEGRKDPDYATTNTVETIKKQIDWLIYYGAKQFLVFSLPDLSKIPEVVWRGPDAAMAIGHLSQTHNEKLAAMVTEEQKLHPDLKFIFVDIAKPFTDIIEHPEKYNLKTSTDICYKGNYDLMLKMTNTREIEAAKEVKMDLIHNTSLRTAYLTAKMAEMGELPCQNPDDYLFWDHIHPTRIGHQIIATMVLSVLNANDIQGPEAS